MSDMGVIARNAAYDRIDGASLGLASLNKVGGTFAIPAKSLAAGYHAAVYAGDETGEVVSWDQTDKRLKTVIRVYSRLDAEDLTACDAFADAVAGILALFLGTGAGLELGSQRATVTEYEVAAVYQPELNQTSLAVRDIVLSLALVM